MALKYFRQKDKILDSKIQVLIYFAILFENNEFVNENSQ